MSIATVHMAHSNSPQRLTIQDQPAHTGGEGRIHFSSDGHYVVKAYLNPSPEKPKLLRQVIELGGYLSQAEQRSLVWPLGVVSQIDGRQCLGVVMKRVPDAFKPLVNLLLPEGLMQAFQNGMSFVELLKMARSIAASVHALHSKDMVHGDLHHGNVLANPKTGETVMIDLDGLIVEGFLTSQVDGMWGFMAPEVAMQVGHPNECTDRFSLAVLILHVLLLRNVMESLVCYDDQDDVKDSRLGYGLHACFSDNSRDTRNRPQGLGLPFFRGGQLACASLPPRLQKLAVRALIAGLRQPSLRPQPQDWENALAECYDILFDCRSCNQSFLYPYWIETSVGRKCPFCGQVAAQGPAVSLRLVEPPPAPGGEPEYGRTLVVAAGYPVFPDVAKQRSLPPFTRRGLKPIGLTVVSKGSDELMLVNVGDEPWRQQAPENRVVRKNESVVLKPGVLFSFGDGMRMAEVVA